MSPISRHFPVTSPADLDIGRRQAGESSEQQKAFRKVRRAACLSEPG
jgi:hypothetical protein